MIRYLLTLAAGVADALAGREKLTVTPATAMTIVTAFSSPRLNMATSFAGAVAADKERNRTGSVQPGPEGS